MGISKNLPITTLLHGAQRLIHDCRPSGTASANSSDEQMTLVFISQSAFPKLHVPSPEPLIAIARHPSDHFVLLWYSDESGSD